MQLEIEVVDIKGDCPVYSLGDKIVLDDGYRVNLAETDAICMHSLASIFPYYVAISKGTRGDQLGLSKEGEEAFVQCLDPMERTGGGTVTFKISRKQGQKASP